MGRCIFQVEMKGDGGVGFTQNIDGIHDTIPVRLIFQPIQLAAETGGIADGFPGGRIGHGLQDKLFPCPVGHDRQANRGLGEADEILRMGIEGVGFQYAGFPIENQLQVGMMSESHQQTPMGSRVDMGMFFFLMRGLGRFFFATTEKQDHR